MTRYTYVIGSNSFIGKNIIENKNSNLNYVGINRKKIDLSNRINSKIVKKNIKKNSILIFLAFKTKHISKTPSIIDNINLIMNCADIIKYSKPKHVILFSSLSVFGDMKNYYNFDENAMVNPDTEYGVAKVFSEKIINSLQKKLKFNLTIIRIPKVFGKHDYENEYGPTSFLNSIIKKTPLKIWGDGEDKKHFLYINDLLKVIELIIKKKIFGTFIIAPEKSYSFKKLATECLKITKSKCELTFKKRTYNGSDHIVKSNKIMKLLKNYKFTKMTVAIKKYYKELKNK